MAGPFQVTAPNAGTEIWTPGGTELVTWNVAGTNAAPVNCGTVNVHLSTDGGYTYPIALASGTANDGTENVNVPGGLQSIQTRVRVACASMPDHFFFDISNANFTVGTPVPPPGCVTSLVVQSLADSGACTLRDTVTAAAAGSTITFSPSLAGSTIVLTSGHILLNKNLTIDGGTNDITISGNNTSRIFDVDAATVTIQALTLTQGNASAAGVDGLGGAVRANLFANLTLNRLTIMDNVAAYGGGGVGNRQSTVTINNSTISDNFGGFSGGVYTIFSSTTINNSTIAGNISTFGNGYGGGVSTQNGTVNINNSTITGNNAPRGGGVGNPFVGSSTYNIRNSTIANNSASVNGDNLQLTGTLHMINTILGDPASGHDDCFLDTGGVIATNTNNLIETGASSSCWTTGLFTGDPNLSPLASNGGWTQTHALNSPSNAIDNGNSTTCSSAPISGLDQRGYTRPATCDIGAYENNGIAPANAPIVSGATFNVNELAPIGTVVGTVVASDPDGGSVTFSIESGNTDDAFVIDPATGQITVQRYQPLYYPTNPQFILTVKVVDDDLPQLSATATVTINVTDINQPPVAEDGSTTILSTTKVGTVIGNVPASDVDPGDTLTWAITAGNTNNAFSIGSNNGTISVANNADFGTFPTYNLTVQVTDNGTPNLSDTVTFTVQVSQCTGTLVTSVADSGPCTLRQAIADAASGATITFADSIAGQTIRLLSTLVINKSLTIEGDTQNMFISGDSNNNGIGDAGDVRVFLVQGGSNVVQINRLTIERGYRSVNTFAEYGGGIRLESANLTLNNVVLNNNRAIFGGALLQWTGTLTINNSTISNNIGGGAGFYKTFGITIINNSTFHNNLNTSAGAGGAIRASGSGASDTLTITNSTFSANQASSFGGGVYAQAQTVTITNSTFSANRGPSGGGGIRIDTTAILHLRNTIIANSITGGDCSNGGTISTNLNNLIEDNTCTPTFSGDPNLGPLASNGGSTQTFALISPSNAINNGDNATCTGASVNGLDQRGYLRNDGACDIGSYEFNAVSATATWDGGGTTNNWSEAANWVGNTVPIAQSQVIFNSTSSKNAVVDVGFGGTVASLSINSGYAGTVSLARSLAVNGNTSVSNGSILDVGTQTFTVEGTFTNNGTVSQTRPATSVGVPVEFLHLTNLAATTDKYFGVTITPTGGSLGNVTVQIKGNQSECTSNPNDEILTRCYDITPATPTAATVRFYFTEAERNGQAADELRIYHYGFPSWAEVGSNLQYSESDVICITGNGQACWVQADGISSFSPFAAGSGGIPSTPTGPTALTSLSFTARTTFAYSSWLIAIGFLLVLGYWKIHRSKA